MPLYEYACSEHGVFEAVRSLAESAAPEPCPTCENLSPRILSLPGRSYMERSQVIARDRNEKSCHEPRFRSGHSHEHSQHGHKHAAPAPSTVRAYKGPRPWVIEHGG